MYFPMYFPVYFPMYFRSLGAVTTVAFDLVVGMSSNG